MRIISGRFKGRRFEPPKRKYSTRPTTDFAREALFNILQNTIDFEQIVMLDLFSGFGMNGFECISRGCQKVYFVEKNRACIGFIKSVSERLKLEAISMIIQEDAFRYISETDLKFDFIFADPPYAHPKMALIPDLIFDTDLLRDNGLFVLEHDQTQDFNLHPNFASNKKYGQSRFSFFIPR